ncbi:MAG TPA: prolipoprotein diacylglyceryl transferase family protein [Candidatus Limnocylindrales bacterium]|nr:prolipoprotein diacylglyceryl transferase family protein [Candidatus Limnocylindrales bacterium]
MPIAVVALDFDPFLHLGDRLVRLETLALAAGILVAFLLAARIARGTAIGDQPGAPSGRSFRADDLVFIVLAAVPGAVVGGRLGYGLVHLDYYAGHPAALLDPGHGSLQLGLAVVGGALSGACATRLLGERAGGWLDVAALPLLVAIAAGKVAMALGGSGQGLPTDAPWATSYLGAGPWGSLAPELPSHPAQLYEAGATLLVLVGAVGLIASGEFGRRDGRLFLAVLAAWAVARAIVAATWRDPPVVGPLRADQLVSIGIAAGCVLLLLASGAERHTAGDRLPEFHPPDPETPAGL